MKTAEITRHKTAATGVKPPTTIAVFMDIYRREGIAGINKGVNAVAIRQCTNWGSRFVSPSSFSLSSSPTSLARDSSPFFSSPPKTSFPSVPSRGKQLS